MSTPHDVLVAALRDAGNAGNALESDRIAAVATARKASAGRDAAVKLASALERENGELTLKVAELEAANAQLVAHQLDDAQMISTLQARINELEARPPCPDPPAEPDPRTGADEARAHVTGQSLAASVAALAFREVGGLSLLTVGPGHHGPLDLTTAHAALLTRRTLRIAGPPGSTLGPITLPESAGVSGCTLELWGIALRGGAHVYSPGFELRLVHGSSAKAPVDIGPPVPV